MYEPPICPACHLHILPGQQSIVLRFGAMGKSKKSGRYISQVHSIDEIHLECGPDYMASAYSGGLYDAILDRLRNEVKRELYEDAKEELRQEIYDEVVDELGRTCAACQDEIDEIAARDEAYSHQSYHPPLPYPAPPGSGFR